MEKKSRKNKFVLGVLAVQLLGVLALVGCETMRGAKEGAKKDWGKVARSTDQAAESTKTTAQTLPEKTATTIQKTDKWMRDHMW